MSTMLLLHALSPSLELSQSSPPHQKARVHTHTLPLTSLNQSPAGLLRTEQGGDPADHIFKYKKNRALGGIERSLPSPPGER